MVMIPIENPVQLFDGSTAVKQNISDNSTKVATTSFVRENINLNIPSITTTGTNTYVASLSPTITSLTTIINKIIFIRFTNANTTASTLNVDTLGAVAIVKNGATALASGDIVANQVYAICYNGTNFQLLGAVGTGGGGGITLLDVASTAGLMSGFPNRSQIKITRNNATRTISIDPDTANSITSFDFLVKGASFNKTTTQSIQVPNIYGIYFIYFDNTGTLQYTTTFNEELLLRDNAYVCNAFYSAFQSKFLFVGTEPHHSQRNWIDHLLEHLKGAKYRSGLSLSNFIVDGDGSLNTHCQFTKDSGVFRDEDIVHTHAATSNLPVFYRIGTEWRRKDADSFPIVYSGQEGYTGANGRLPYNQLVSSNYQFTELGENEYVLGFIFEINDDELLSACFLGTQKYTTIESARVGAIVEIAEFGSTNIPFQEFVPIGIVIFKSSSGYTNTPKGAIVSTDTGADYVDVRLTTAYNILNSSNSHLTLGDTTDPACHPQYVQKALYNSKGGILTTTSNQDNLLILPAHANNKRVISTESSLASGLLYRSLGEMVDTNYESWGYEDWITNSTTGSNGWGSSVAGTGAAVGIDQSKNLTGNRWGIYTIASGTTSTGRVGYSLGGFWGGVSSNLNAIAWEIDFNIPILSTAGQAFTLWIGSMDNYNIATTPGVGFYLSYTHSVNGGRFLMNCSQVATSSQDSGITVVANTWYTFTAVKNMANNSVVFYLNGTPVATISTNLPSGLMGIMVIKGAKSAGTTSRVFCLFDKFSYNIKYANARGF